MKKLLKLFILFCAFVVATVLPSLAQVTALAVPNGNAMPATAVPADQAPDSVMKKLSDLVHAGKYAEAQQLTAGLLLAYPEDQRLIKAKALLDKSLAAASAKAIPSADPSASDSEPTPATGTAATQLSGMDKVEYNTLIELAREAQQGTGLERQRASLSQFMDKSRAFLQKHPDQILLWQLRAASAISLNDPMAAYEAGQKLIATGAADSNDPNMQRLLAQLNSKGWLDKQKAEDDNKYGGVLGTWKVSCSRIDGAPDQDGNKEVFVKTGSGNIEGYFMFESVGHKEPRPNMRGTLGVSGEVSWELYLEKMSSKDGKNLDPEEPGGRYFNVNSIPGKQLYPSGWQPPIDYVRSPDKQTMTMKWPRQTPNMKRDSNYISEHPVIWTFEKISD
jgi:hypothetical protein